MSNLGARFKVKSTRPSTSQVRKARQSKKETNQWISKATGIRRFVVFNAELKKLIKKILLKKDTVPQILKIATTIFNAVNKANVATVNKVSELMSKIQGKTVTSKTGEFFDTVVKIALKAGITLSKYDLDQIYQLWRKVTNQNFKLLMSIAVIPSSKMTAEDQKKISALQKLLSSDIKKKAPKKKKKPKTKKKTTTRKKRIKKPVKKTYTPSYPRYEGQAEREVNKRMAS